MLLVRIVVGLVIWRFVTDWHNTSIIKCIKFPQLGIKINFNKNNNVENITNLVDFHMKQE